MTETTENAVNIVNVFKLLSYPEVLYILKSLSTSNRNANELKIDIQSRFKLGRRSYYSRINRLANLGLVGRTTHLLYFITSLGRTFLDLQLTAEYALDNHNVMRMIDSLKEFPQDHRNGLIENIINNPHIKNILLQQPFDNQPSTLSLNRHKDDIINPRIMVVDDDNDVLTAIKVILEDASYSVDVFNDSFEALKQFVNVSASGHPYDLVILDIKMPHFNGLELYQRIKAVNATIRTMFLSALVVKSELISILPGIDSDSIIEKPVSQQELIRRVKKNTDEKRGEVIFSLSSKDYLTLF
jgi:CheY-like chemotaxis protein